MFQSPIPSSRARAGPNPVDRKSLAKRRAKGVAAPVPTAPRRPLAGFEPARAFFAECFAAADPAIETLFVAYLDKAARCINLSRHEGGASEIAWPLRAILLEAARCNCDGLIVAHNHPSGDANPSHSDCDATRRLATAAEAIDVTLVDHLIFAAADCSSFRRRGLL